MFPILDFTLLGSSIQIPMFNLLIGIGIVIGILNFQFICKRQKIKTKDMDNLMTILCIAIVFGFLSAVLFDKIAHFHTYNEFLAHLFEYTGMTFEGGLIGGLVSFFIFYKVIMMSFDHFEQNANCIAPSVVIAHCFGRIGCFFGGCCFGKPTKSFIGVQFPNGSLAEQYYGPGIKVIPTQLIEAIFLLVLFLLLTFILFRHAFSYYLIFYGIFRFIIEFFRGDNRGTLFQTFLSPSQCLSILMGIAGLALLCKYTGKRQKHYIRIGFHKLT